MLVTNNGRGIILDQEISVFFLLGENLLPSKLRIRLAVRRMDFYMAE